MPLVKLFPMVYNAFAKTVSATAKFSLIIKMVPAMNKEKRGYDRGYTLLYVTLCDGKKFLKEFVHNTSPGGLMIKSRESWRVGTILDMIIHAHVPIRTKGRVAWVNRDEYVYKIGIEFEEMSSDAATWWDHVLNSLLGNPDY